METITYFSNTESDTKKLATLIAKDVNPGFILLAGDLSAGKTTFTKYLAAALKITKLVNSPTFVIMNEFAIPKKSFQLIHIDAYRLQASEELAMYQEAFSENLNVIEWYQNITPIIDFGNALILEWEIISSKKRKVTISGQGKNATRVVKSLRNG